MMIFLNSFTQEDLQDEEGQAHEAPDCMLFDLLTGQLGALDAGQLVRKLHITHSTWN